ncbi:hypothetical protein J1614_003341 [Plenodomus biglobosus]|nr:hypothetical protein J1614_003341 [Plenodomus biglobosus]
MSDPANPPESAPAFRAEAVDVAFSAAHNTMQSTNRPSGQPANAAAAVEAPAPPIATDRVEFFIATHTAEEREACSPDECPVCLHNYHETECVRITNIEGCTHRIHLACLRDLLNHNPDREKRCPLCRAIWIVSTARRARPVGIIGPSVNFSIARNWLINYQNLQGSPGRDVARRTDRGAPPTPRPYPETEVFSPSYRHANEGQQPSLRQQMDAARDGVNLVRVSVTTTREDYEAEVRNFENFNRDLENLRQRAQDTPFMGRRRNRRRGRNNRNNGNSSGQSDNNASLGTDGGHVDIDSVDEGPTRRLLNRLRAAAGNFDSGGSQLLHEDQRLRAPVPRSPTANAAAGADAETATRSQSTPASTTNTAPAHPRRVSSLRATAAEIQSPLGGSGAFGGVAPQSSTESEAAGSPAQDTAASHRSSTSTRVEPPNTEYLRTRVATLNAHEIALTRREIALFHREDELSLREADMTRREDTLTDREAANELVMDHRRGLMDSMGFLLEHLRDVLGALRYESEL